MEQAQTTQVEQQPQAQQLHREVRIKTKKAIHE